MAYRFRKISEEDNNVIASIIRNNLEQFHLDIPGTAYYDEGLDRLSECYKDPGSGYFVLVGDDGRVVGGIGYSAFPMMRDTAELQKLYLDPAVKGEGLGYGMIRYVEEQMRSSGFRRSYLETHDNLQAAIHIYEKSGYLEIEKPENIGHSSMNRFFVKEL